MLKISNTRLNGENVLIENGWHHSGHRHGCRWLRRGEVSHQYDPRAHMVVGGTFPEKFDGFLHPRSMTVICLFPQFYMICWFIDLGQHSLNLEKHTRRKAWRFSEEYTGLNLQFKYHLYYFLKLSCLRNSPFSYFKERNLVPLCCLWHIALCFEKPPKC